MNKFVGVPEPDSPHKPLPILVDSARVDACASLVMSAAWTFASAGGFLLENLGSFRCSVPDSPSCRLQGRSPGRWLRRLSRARREGRCEPRLLLGPPAPPLLRT